MLRRTLLASAGVMALAGTAFAADLTPPPLVMPPVFSWTGIYAGINAGYHWGGSSFSFAGADTDGGGLGAALGAGAIPTTGVGGASGFIGGGQIGYNYQISSIVLGLEVDIDGATGRNSTTTVAAPTGFVPIATENAQQLNWLGTVRGRTRLVAVRQPSDLRHRRLGLRSVHRVLLGGCSGSGTALVCFHHQHGQRRLDRRGRLRICLAEHLVPLVELVGESRVSLL